MYLNLSKFNIALEGKLLIFAWIQVSSEGHLMDMAWLDAIREFGRPRTNKELQRWLGLWTSLGQFAAFPLKDRLPLKQQFLQKNYSKKLKWNHKQMEEFETARQEFSDSSQMLQPFNPALAMGLVVDTAKTNGIGYILFPLPTSV